MIDRLAKAQPIWVARAILFYLLYINIKHQQQDFGGYGIDSWLYAIAMEVSISVGLSGIVTILLTGRHWARFLILLFVPVLIIGAQNSVDASKRVFAKNKVDQIEHERLGVEGQMSRNNLIMAGNALNRLRAQGITAGLSYDNALSAYQAARVEAHNSKSKSSESTSEKALKLTNETSGTDTDSAVISLSERRAWLLLGFVLLFSAVSGLWTMLTTGVGWIVSTEDERPKKRQGPSQPARNTANAIDYMEVAPKAKRDPQLTVSMPTSPPKVDIVQAGAREVMRRLKSGSLRDCKTGELCRDTIPMKAITDINSNTTTRKNILREVEKLGGVELRRQGKKEIAYIADQYRPTADPVFSALTGLDIPEPRAKMLAKSAAGETPEARIKSALKLHGAVA